MEDKKDKLKNFVKQRLETLKELNTLKAEMLGLKEDKKNLEGKLDGLDRFLKELMEK